MQELALHIHAMKYARLKQTQNPNHPTLDFLTALFAVCAVQKHMHHNHMHACGMQPCAISVAIHLSSVTAVLQQCHNAASPQLLTFSTPAVRARVAALGLGACSHDDRSSVLLCCSQVDCILSHGARHAALTCCHQHHPAPCPSAVGRLAAGGCFALLFLTATAAAAKSLKVLLHWCSSASGCCTSGMMGTGDSSSQSILSSSSSTSAALDMSSS